MNVFYGPCLVCNDVKNTSMHFGVNSCAACAAFFRRTTENQYACSRNNNCATSYERKILCRACRYTNCLKAGMSRGNEASSQRSIPSSGSSNSSSTSRSNSPQTYSGFSKILKIHHEDLLQFYLEEVEKTMSQKRRNVSKNILLAKSFNELMIITAHEHGSAMEACIDCPGVDHLEQEDLKVLLKYVQFANVWIDSVRAYSVSDIDCFKEVSGRDDRLTEFLQQVKSTLGSAFAELKLNIYEFAAFKAFCIWKLGFFSTSRTMKTVAEDHYDGVSSALRNYYKNQLKMDDCDIAIRLGNITLQIVTVTNIYHDLICLHLKVGMPI